jgi:hypothetical protein
MWPSAQLRRASPKNHQGKIIPSPHCLTTVNPRPRQNAYRNQTRAELKRGKGERSNVAVCNASVCVRKRQSAVGGLQ